MKMIWSTEELDLKEEEEGSRKWRRSEEPIWQTHEDPKMIWRTDLENGNLENMEEKSVEAGEEEEVQRRSLSSTWIPRG